MLATEHTLLRIFLNIWRQIFIRRDKDDAAFKNRGDKTRHWLERYHFMVSTLAFGLKINFDQPIKWMELQKLEEIKWLAANL